MNKECCGSDMDKMQILPVHKKWFWIIVSIIVLTLTYSAYLAASSYSESIQPSSFRSFNVDGEGKITAIPDVARFTFGLITEGGKDIAKLQKENTEKMNKAIDFIKSMDVADKDIKTENYNLNPKYQYYDCSRIYTTNGEAKPCPPAEIVGYTINQTVSVKVRDFSKIGDILSGVVKNGANNVSQLYFELDDPSATIEKAREMAIKKAMDKAYKVAKVGGFRVGRLLSIDEGNQPYPVMRNYYKSEAAGVAFDMAAPTVAPQVEAGSQEITVNVNLRYEIK